jgi:hypothetical protein
MSRVHTGPIYIGAMMMVTTAWAYFWYRRHPAILTGLTHKQFLWCLGTAFFAGALLMIIAFVSPQ